MPAKLSNPTVFLFALLASLGLLGALVSSNQAPGRTAPVTPGDGFQTSVKPFLQTYCFG